MTLTGEQIAASLPRLTWHNKNVFTVEIGIKDRGWRQHDKDDETNEEDDTYIFISKIDEPHYITTHYGNVFHSSFELAAFNFKWNVKEERDRVDVSWSSDTRFLKISWFTKKELKDQTLEDELWEQHLVNVDMIRYVHVNPSY